MRLASIPILGLLMTTSVLAQAPATAASKESVAYYLGESKVVLAANGREVGRMVMLIKRVLKPAEHVIEEHVLVASSESAEPIKEIIMTMIVDEMSKSFKLKDASGTLEGTGDLVGESWAWKQWSSTTVIPGPRGGTIKSQDTLTEDGLQVKKQLLGEDGKPRIVFEESYRTISASFYAILHERLLKAEKKK